MITNQRRVEDVPVTDRPISEKKLSGIGHFLGLYGGEHIAADEFVFGAVMVTWGCSLKMILLGLIIGNFLAVLSFTFLCSKLAAKTRLTLYSYLKKVLGPYAQKCYSLVWGLCSTLLAAGGFSVSATALKEIVGIGVQHEWYPTSIGFVIAVILFGTVITIVAANGFEACAKFSATCVPWMVSMFFIGGLISLSLLANATGVSIASFKDIWNILDSSVGLNSGMSDSNFGFFHVISFAWIANLAWHVGLNDMGLFRFAKDYKYGFASAIGMYVGHFFAWTMAAIMGATTAALLRLSILEIDPGLTANTVMGAAGICTVIVAGWTTANPTIYRCALSINSVFPKLTHKQSTYLIGIVTTALACFPVVQNVPYIALIMGWATAGIGAVCIVEEYLFPKLGYTKYWAMYKKQSVNWAAMITWSVGIIFVLAMLLTDSMNEYFIFLPQYILSVVLYIVLAGWMGAKQDYSKEAAEEEEFQRQLRTFVDNIAEEKLEEAEVSSEKDKKIPKLLKKVSFAVLACLLASAFITFAGGISFAAFKAAALMLTILYFILNGTATFIQYRNESFVLQ